LALSRLLDLSGANAGQIKFPSTPNLSSDLHTLDEYTEITSWIPTITFNNSAGVGVTYGTCGGCAAKIGDVVVASGILSLSSKGSSSGFIQIASLPWVAKNTGIAFQFVSVGAYANCASITGGLTGVIASSTNQAQLYMGGSATAAALTQANITNTSQFEFAAVYQV
jgi:hypothetical protein